MKQNEELKDNEEPWWIIHFDGAVSEKGAEARIWLSPPKNKTDRPSLYSYKLYFQCTNNVEEYEALILGLNVLKKLKEKMCIFMEPQS
jgi:ribonuclease HI